MHYIYTFHIYIYIYTTYRSLIKHLVATTNEQVCTRVPAENLHGTSDLLQHVPKTKGAGFERGFLGIGPRIFVICGFNAT